MTMPNCGSLALLVSAIGVPLSIEESQPEGGTGE